MKRLSELEVGDEVLRSRVVYVDDSDVHITKVVLASGQILEHNGLWAKPEPEYAVNGEATPIPPEMLVRVRELMNELQTLEDQQKQIDDKIEELYKKISGMYEQYKSEDLAEAVQSLQNFLEE